MLVVLVEALARFVARVSAPPKADLMCVGLEEASAWQVYPVRARLVEHRIPLASLPLVVRFPPM